MQSRTNGEGAALKLAVLIDADNVSAKYVKELFAEIRTYGDPISRRLYGDFSSPHISGWDEVLLEHAIKPCHLKPYTKGKNATDSALIIDAMDLLYTERLDGFCLVTSDSDYTGLAMRLQDGGMTVFGFGEAKTPESFRKACNKFVLIEVLGSVSEPATSDLPAERSHGDVKAPEPPKIDKASLKLMRRVLESISDETGWVSLGTFGSQLTKEQSDFDHRRWKFNRLNELIKSLPAHFCIEERTYEGSAAKHYYVSLKQPTKSKT